LSIAVNFLNQRVSQMLSQLDSTQGAQASQAGQSGGFSCDAASGSSASSSGNSLTGPSKASVSDDILALLTQLQQLTGQLGGSASSPTSSTSISTSTSVSTISTTASATTMASSSTLATPLSQLFSAIDTDGDGSISQGEMESFVQKLGGTSAEGDALYAGLSQGNSGGITQAQLGNDLQQAQQAQQTSGGHHHHRHHVPSADSVANQLVSAADGDDSSDSDDSDSIDQSQMDSFVTSLGGTTSEANSDFAALDTGNTGSVNAGQIASAIKAFETAANATVSYNSASPILTLLDSLGADAATGPSGVTA
jgi:Ca2+-binding EF-hand superfamily protein